MKKSIALFLAVLELLLFCGCSANQYRKQYSKLVTPEQSTTNFEIYKERLDNICLEYGLRLSALGSTPRSIEYGTMLNSYDEITIYFSNDSFRGEKRLRVMRFIITYNQVNIIWI